MQIDPQRSANDALGGQKTQPKAAAHHCTCNLADSIILYRHYSDTENSCLQPLCMSDQLKTTRTLSLQWILMASFLLLAGSLAIIRPADAQQHAGSNLMSQPGAGPPGPVEIQTVWSTDGIRTADTVLLAVVFDIQKGFHINADAGQLLPMKDFRPVPTRVTVTSASEGLQLESVVYPPAHAVSVGFAQGKLMSFEGRTVVYLPMTLTAPPASEKNTDRSAGAVSGL